MEMTEKRVGEPGTRWIEIIKSGQWRENRWKEEPHESLGQ